MMNMVLKIGRLIRACYIPTKEETKICACYIYSQNFKNHGMLVSITCILFGAGCNKGVLVKDCDDIFLLYKTILYSF